MKNTLVIFSVFCFLNKAVSQTITYNFTALSGTYIPNATATSTVDPALSPSSNDALSGAPVPIGFTFQYGCTGYTQILTASNGWLTFNPACIAGSGDPNNQLAGNITQTGNAERPILAPLWDDLDVNYLGPTNGNVSYQRLGAAGSRTFTIEWNKMMWSANASGAVISFQVKLYEGTNIIDFIYQQEASAPYAGTFTPKTSASIGITGIPNGNYYSVQSTGAAPAVTNNAGEVSTLNTKPATGQVYRWTPVCALPIELISFTGETADNKNILRWSTANESDNAYFTIEKSGDASVFYEIATVKGAGNSDDQKNYEFTDARTDGALAYYRLKQVDASAVFSYSKVIAIDDNAKNDAVNVFPVPASGQLTVSGTRSDNYSLTDISGKVVREGMLLNGSIDVSCIENGFYFLKLNNAAVIRRVLVQH